MFRLMSTELLFLLSSRIPLAAIVSRAIVRGLTTSKVSPLRNFLSSKDEEDLPNLKYSPKSSKSVNAGRTFFGYLRSSFQPCLEKRLRSRERGSERDVQQLSRCVTGKSRFLRSTCPGALGTILSDLLM